MFVFSETGVVVVDAPQAYAPHSPRLHPRSDRGQACHASSLTSTAIRNADQYRPGPGARPGLPYLAHEETSVCCRANDAARPLPPTVTFRTAPLFGSAARRSSCSYHGYGHAPRQQSSSMFPVPGCWMVVDSRLPGLAALAAAGARGSDLTAPLPSHETYIEAWTFSTSVRRRAMSRAGAPGRMFRVQAGIHHMNDLRAAGVRSDPTDASASARSRRRGAIPAVFERTSFIDRDVVECVNRLLAQMADSARASTTCSSGTSASR